MSHAGLLISFLAVGFLPASGPGSPVAGPVRADAERLVRRYYAEVASEPDSTKSDTVLNEILSRDFLFSFGNGRYAAKGIDEHKRWCAWHHRVGSGQSWTVEDLIIENGAAASRFLLTLTHQASFLGIPATGKTITVRGVDLFRVSDGRIVELYRVFDGRDVVLQMGAACPPATTVPTNREP